MTKKITLLGVMACAHAILFNPGANAQTNTFPDDTWIALTKPGNVDAAKNYTLYTSDSAGASTFTALASFTSPQDILGCGINPIDNYIYGTGYAGNPSTMSSILNVDLFRITSTGALTNLGRLPVTGTAPDMTSNFFNITLSAEITNFSAGTVDADGRYYYTTIALTPAGVNKVNAYFSSATPLNLVASNLRMYICWINNAQTLNGTNMPSAPSGYYELNTSNPVIQGALGDFVTQFNSLFPLNINDIEGGIQDFAVHPTNGNVYAYISYHNTSNQLVGRPVSFTTPLANQTSTVTTIGSTINTTPGVDIAGVQFAQNGNFYGLFNDGSFARINLTSGALQNVANTNLTLIGGELRGDLASGITGDFVLPVDLLSFSGKNGKGYNDLLWEITAESKGKEFVIERSSDGRSFEAIGNVTLNSGKTNYSFTDQSPLAVNYYRLKIVDVDAKLTYSHTVVLKIGAAATAATIYPTVVTEGWLNIETAATDYSVSVTNLAGATVYNGTVHQSGNVHRLAIPGLATGSYIIHIQSDDNAVNASEKFLVK